MLFLVYKREAYSKWILANKFIHVGFIFMLVYIFLKNTGWVRNLFNYLQYIISKNYTLIPTRPVSFIHRWKYRVEPTRLNANLTIYYGLFSKWFCRTRRDPRQKKTCLEGKKVLLITHFSFFMVKSGFIAGGGNISYRHFS